MWAGLSVKYPDMEAVQGPAGSSREVADLTGLLGAATWESWIVKLGPGDGERME